MKRRGTFGSRAGIYAVLGSTGHVYKMRGRITSGLVDEINRRAGSLKWLSRGIILWALHCVETPNWLWFDGNDFVKAHSVRSQIGCNDKWVHHNTFNGMTTSPAKYFGAEVSGRGILEAVVVVVGMLVKM